LKLWHLEGMAETLLKLKAKGILWGKTLLM
jgi:hypothetical protein